MFKFFLNSSPYFLIGNFYPSWAGYAVFLVVGLMALQVLVSVHFMMVRGNDVGELFLRSYKNRLESALGERIVYYESQPWWMSGKYYYRDGLSQIVFYVETKDGRAFKVLIGSFFCGFLTEQFWFHSAASRGEYSRRMHLQDSGYSVGLGK